MVVSREFLQPMDHPGRTRHFVWSTGFTGFDRKIQFQVEPHTPWKRTVRPWKMAFGIFQVVWFSGAEWSKLYHWCQDTGQSMIRWLSRCQVLVSDQARLFDSFYICRDENLPVPGDSKCSFYSLVMDHLTIPNRLYMSGMEAHPLILFPYNF